MKDFQTTPELLEYIDKAYELNNGQYSKNEILLQLVERGYNFKGETLENVMLQNTDWQNKLIEAVSKPDNAIDFSSEEWENALSFGDEQPATEGENKVSKDNANNFKILKSLTDEYETLCFKKAILIQENQGGEGLNKNGDKYKQYIKNLSDIDKRLSEIEDGPEMHELMQSIKEDGLGDKWYQGTGGVRILLNDIVNKVGTQSITKNNPHYAGKQRDPQPGFTDKLPELIDKYEGQSDNSSNKSEVDKKTGGTKLKNPNDIFKSTRMVDNMSFGGDVKDNEYLNRRNDTLAKHLKANGIETPEEIEEYLNKYPSWKDAKQEWKDNTVSILADKVSKLNGKKEDKGENKGEKKGEFGGEGWKENDDGSKTSPDGVTTVREDGSISFGTDNESPLNDVELAGKDKFWNDYWNEEEAELEKGNMNEDTLNGAGDKKKEKKDNKNNKITMNDVIKVVKSSPTIKNLLKK